MSEALTPLFLIAALVLCLAGLSKLRAPQAAAGALESLGLRASVRLLAAGEVALGAACAVHPTRATAGVLGAVYALFAVAAAILRRRRVACGCFGDNDTPVSRAHVIASELLGTLAVAAAIVPPHGLGWVVVRPALLIGVAGAAYAVVLVYTAVPRAWAAWSGE